MYASLRPEILWFNGLASKLNFWTDRWIIPSVADQLVIPEKELRQLLDSVSNFLINDSWHLGHVNDPVVVSNIMAISSINHATDIGTWTIVYDEAHSVKNMHDKLWYSRNSISWNSFIWKKILPPSHSRGVQF